jgi:NADP-dependent 3-hydroxy acid dehydrogenase YdfG
MKKTLVVCGHGPGISDAVARRFGREGFAVALVARTKERLEAAAAALREAGVEARAFPCDLGDPDAVATTLGQVAESLGPVVVVHYNAYGGAFGDLLTVDLAALRTAFDTSVTGLLAAVRAALPTLKEAKGSVLVTGGGFAFYDRNVDAMATRFGAGALAIGKASQHKTVGLLAQRLEGEGVFVGEVVVLGTVKGTRFDSGAGTLEASDIAERFWRLHVERDVTSVNFS